MEIRVIIISDSGQVTPEEFKTYDEAIDCLVKKSNGSIKVIHEEIAMDVAPETVSETTPQPRGVINSLINSLKRV